MTFTLNALNDGSGEDPEVQYDYTVTSTATAGGSYGGGTWTQTTTNYAAIDYFMGVATETGHGQTTATFAWSQPYSSGSSSQPVNGTEYESDVYQDSYDYSTATGVGQVESSGSESESYAGGGTAYSSSGSGSSSTGWTESENGSDVSSYDLTNSLAYDDGEWTMTAGNNASSGNGSTYQWQMTTGNISGNSSQSSQAETSYSYQENSAWSAASGWAPASGTETDSQNGWSDSTQDTTSAYSIPFSGGSSTGGGSTGGNSPFALSGGSVSYSGSGTESTSGDSSSSYSSTGNYTLASDGTWQGVSGTGWSQGNSFSASSYSGGGTYSYNIPAPSGAGTEGSCSYGCVSGDFTESGQSQNTQQYQTEATLGPAGWLQTGWMWTDSSNESYQSASGSGSFDIPAPSVGLGGGSEGFAYNGTTTESNGQSSYADVTSDYTLDADGNWQQTAGHGTNTSATWQSSSQEGEYSHAVNGVALEGTFSQSASQSDNSSYTTGGSPGSGGQWVPSGTGSDTQVTSSSSNYDGSGSATAFLAVNGSYDWPSTGTQFESESASANASYTTDYALQPMSASGSASGSGVEGYSWQATGGNGTTSGGQTTTQGYSGGGQYTVGGGDIVGSFSQAQSDTTSWGYETQETDFPDVAGSNPSTVGWQTTSGNGTTVDSGGDSFSYSGTGSYNDGYGGGGALSQSGSASDSFSYSKDYAINYDGNGDGTWQVEGGTGGAAGSGGTFASYDGQTPCSVALAGAPSGSTAMDDQSGSNSTSYSFNTTAVFNGLDWSETGLKTSSGSGSTSDQFAASCSGQSFSASNSASYGYTEQAYLDDNGVWQGLPSAAGGEGGGTVSASASVEDPDGWDSGAATGSVGLSYTQNFSQVGGGQFQAASASGNFETLPAGITPPSPMTGGNATNSLVSQASWPAAVDAVWGMAMTADAAPETFLGEGNGTPGSGGGTPSGFTSETMREANVVLGPDNVAVVFPVTRSPVLVDGGLNNVAAGNVAGGWQSGQVSTSDADVSGGPMAVADADGTAPAATPAGAGVAGGASLPGNQILPESGRAPNGFSLGERRDLPTGAATASPLPRELLLTEVFPQVRSPTTNPPSPLAENPRERLKAALHGIGQGSSWSNEQWSQYDNGFADGFIAGMEGTLNLIQSAPKLFWDAITLKTERAVLGAGVKLTLWSWAVVGDEIGSWWYGTPPVELKEGVAQSRAALNTAATAARIAADLNAMGYEMLKTVLVEGSNPNTPKPAELQKEEAAAIDRALGRASPLTIALLDLVAEAVYDLSPHDQGYIVGLVAEQVVEWAVVSAATEGAGAAAELTGLNARVAKVLETTKEFASSERLQAVVKALRDVLNGGRSEEQIVEELTEARKALGVCFAAGTEVLVPAIGAQHRNRRGVKAQDDGQSGYEQLEAGICVLVGLAGLHLMDQNYRKRKKSDEEEDELFSGDRVREPRFRINGSPKDASPSPKNSESRMSQCVETASVEAAGCLQSPPCGALCAVADGLQDDLPTMLARRSDRARRRNRKPSSRCTIAGITWLAAFLALAGFFSRKTLLPQPTERKIAAASASDSVPSWVGTAIEDIRVGQRVIAHNPDPAASVRTAKIVVDPATWRRLRLRAEETWPDGTLDVVEVETLQPPEWVKQCKAEPGAFVPLPLDLLEMGLPESLHARVVANEPCPTIMDGPGCVVLTTVNHLNPSLFELTLRDESGRVATVEPTGLHKFYSADRGAWTDTEDLFEGERLRSINGWLTVEKIERVPGVHRVYNMTVAGEHVFHVSSLGLLSHNNNPCAIPAKVGTNQAAQRELVSMQQERLKAAIDAAPEGEKAAARGRALNTLGRDFQDLSTNTLEQIPGATVEENVRIATGTGSVLDDRVSLNGKSVLVESKYSLNDINERMENQINNAVKANGSAILNVARKPTPGELAELESRLGKDVFNKVKVVSSQIELYEAAIFALQ